MSTVTAYQVLRCVTELPDIAEKLKYSEALRGYIDSFGFSFTNTVVSEVGIE